MPTPTPASLAYKRWRAKKRCPNKRTNDLRDVLVFYAVHDDTPEELKWFINMALQHELARKKAKKTNAVRNDALNISMYSACTNSGAGGSLVWKHYWYIGGYPNATKTYINGMHGVHYHKIGAMWTKLLEHYAKDGLLPKYDEESFELAMETEYSNEEYVQAARSPLSLADDTPVSTTPHVAYEFIGEHDTKGEQHLLVLNDKYVLEQNMLFSEEEQKQLMPFLEEALEEARSKGKGSREGPRTQAVNAGNHAKSNSDVYYKPNLLTVNDHEKALTWEDLTSPSSIVQTITYAVEDGDGHNSFGSPQVTTRHAKYDELFEQFPEAKKAVFSKLVKMDKERHVLFPEQAAAIDEMVKKPDLYLEDGATLTSMSPEMFIGAGCHAITLNMEEIDVTIDEESSSFIPKKAVVLPGFKAINQIGEMVRTVAISDMNRPGGECCIYAHFDINNVPQWNDVNLTQTFLRDGSSCHRIVSSETIFEMANVSQVVGVPLQGVAQNVRGQEDVQISVSVNSVQFANSSNIKHMATGMAIIPREVCTSMHIPLQTDKVVKAKRLSFVMRFVMKTLRFSRLCKRAGGAAVAVKRPLREYLVAKGVFPLTKNQMPGSKHAKKHKALYDLAKVHEINEALRTDRSGKDINQDAIATCCREVAADLASGAIQKYMFACPQRGYFDAHLPCKAPATCMGCSK